MKSKRAAMEMSVGTIVTIVLLVTVLILGVVLIKNIFSSAKGVVDLTDTQLRNEINKLFSEENKVSIYPGTRFVEIKQGSSGDGVGLGIRNLLTGASSNKKFSYQVSVSDADIQEKCGISDAIAEGWISTGKSEEDIAIASGDFAMQRITFEIPIGSPLCTIRFRINVQADGANYATDFFDVKVKAK